MKLSDKKVAETVRTLAMRAAVGAARKKPDNGREETDYEVQVRFAQLRLERAKEFYGPMRPDKTNVTYGDVNDFISDEEFEYGCLGLTSRTPVEKRAAILADPANQDQVKRCEELKRKRDSLTRFQKREARQKVNGYMLTYTDDTPEEAQYWEQKKQEYREANPGWKNWF